MLNPRLKRSLPMTSTAVGGICWRTSRENYTCQTPAATKLFPRAADECRGTIRTFERLLSCKDLARRTRMLPPNLHQHSRRIVQAPIKHDVGRRPRFLEVAASLADACLSNQARFKHQALRHRDMILTRLFDRVRGTDRL